MRFAYLCGVQFNCVLGIQLNSCLIFARTNSNRYVFKNDYLYFECTENNSYMDSASILMPTCPYKTSPILLFTSNTVYNMFVDIPNIQSFNDYYVLIFNLQLKKVLHEQISTTLFSIAMFVLHHHC